MVELYIINVYLTKTYTQVNDRNLGRSFLTNIEHSIEINVIPPCHNKLWNIKWDTFGRKWKYRSVISSGIISVNAYNNDSLNYENPEYKGQRDILAILFRLFGFLPLKFFQIIWLYTYLTLRVPDEGYSRNASCPLKHLIYLCFYFIERNNRVVNEIVANSGIIMEHFF